MIKHTRTNIDIETENLERFKEIFPMHGGIKWFVNGCFRHFNSLHAEGHDEMVKEVVEAVVEEIREEGEEGE